MSAQLKMTILHCFSWSRKSCWAFACLPYNAKSKCAGEPRTQRVEWWVKLDNPTGWRRTGGFHKKVAMVSRVCRTSLIRSALESPNASEVAGWPESRISTHKLLSRDSRFWPSSHFRTHHVSPKMSGFDVWPTVRRARVGTFQRTSN